MATYSRTMRRGLPRRSGGESWPPEGASPARMVEDAAVGNAVDDLADAAEANGAAHDSTSAETTAAAPAAGSTAKAGGTADPGAIVDAAAMATTTRPAGKVSRRGLPRVPGGEAWPPVSGQAVVAESDIVHADAIAPQTEMMTTSAAAPTAGQAASSSSAAGPPRLSTDGHPLRRGLPRVQGGERWPAATAVVGGQRQDPAAPNVSLEPEPEPDVPPVEKAKPRVPATTTHNLTPAEPSAAVESAAAAVVPAPAREEKRGKELSRPGALVLGGIGLLVLAVAAVLFMRWFVTLGFMQEFLVSYPGETELPANAQQGFPAWVQWQHFFNTFLIVLIIRSGLQVRGEERPSGYWTPRWSKGGNGKISLNLWFHQALDVLWLVNGVVFVVLLFATGHWMRLVPTTWEVFPNALSAAIQYVSLDWPTENGWVNYNSLQMLMYFLTVFVAAPLAAISGARMSGIWPKNAKTLNQAYPVEWARAVHFPVMLYFVVFIIIHVALVFATGALRNLNHMYGGQDVVNWAGFWIFFVSLLLIVGAWIAARPLVLAPIAGLFGRVSSR